VNRSLGPGRTTPSAASVPLFVAALHPIRYIVRPWGRGRSTVTADSPVEALVWAEITRVGGTQRDFDRLRMHPGYLFDLTACPGEAELRFEDDPPTEPAPIARNRRFLQSTIEWFVRHRDELDDLHVQLILDWALHCHTETCASTSRPCMAQPRALSRVFPSVHGSPGADERWQQPGTGRWSIATRPAAGHGA
jgi:hypothetical protein